MITTIAMTNHTYHMRKNSNKQRTNRGRKIIGDIAQYNICNEYKNTNITKRLPILHNILLGELIAIHNRLIITQNTT